MNELIKLVLLDDHEVLLDGLSLIIDNDPRYKVVGQFTNPKYAISFLRTNQVDVVFMDINMPLMDGITATRVIREFDRHVRILGLSMLDEPMIVRQLQNCGGNGFLLKNCSTDTVLQAIQEVIEVGHYYDKGLIAKLVVQPNPTELQHPKLSRREKEILKLIIDEHTTKEIADILNISFGTVETHRRNMINKLAVRNTAGLVRRAINDNLLE